MTCQCFQTADRLFDIDLRLELSIATLNPNEEVLAEWGQYVRLQKTNGVYTCVTNGGLRMTISNTNIKNVQVFARHGLQRAHIPHMRMVATLSCRGKPDYKKALIWRDFFVEWMEKCLCDSIVQLRTIVEYEIVQIKDYCPSARRALCHNVRSIITRFVFMA